MVEDVDEDSEVVVVHQSKPRWPRAPRTTVGAELNSNNLNFNPFEREKYVSS